MKKSKVYYLLTLLCFVTFGAVTSIMNIMPHKDFSFWILLFIMAAAVIFKDLEKDASTRKHDG